MPRHTPARKSDPSLESSARRRRSRRTRAPKYWPTLESLEGRVVLSTMVWINPGGGDWDDGANWADSGNPSTHHVPTASDDAVIDLAGITVTHSSAVDDAVHSLVNEGALDLSAGSLSVATTVEVDELFTLSGGTLQGAEVVAGTTITGTNAGGILDGVTLDGDLDLTTVYNATVTVANGLTLNGTASLGDAAGTTTGRIFFDGGTQALGGTGTVVFGGWMTFGGGGGNQLGDAYPVTTTLTIGAGITVHGKEGTINPQLLIVDGTVTADVAGRSIHVKAGVSVTGTGIIVADGGTVQIQGGDLTDDGTLEAISGGKLNIAVTGAIAGSGAITTTGGTVDLEGDFSLDPDLVLDTSGGKLSLTGHLDNTGSVLSLDDDTGPLYLTGGSIDGGTVVAAGSAKLIAPSRNGFSAGILSDVTLDADLDLTTSSSPSYLPYVSIEGDLTLNGTIFVGNASGSVHGALEFTGGAQTVGGTGSILFGASSGNRLSDNVFAGGPTLTIGAGILVHGKCGSIQVLYGSLINDGTIAADVAEGLVSAFNGNQGQFVNHGTLEATDGATLSVSWRGTGSSNDGTLHATSGGVINVSIAGPGAVNDGTLLAEDDGRISVSTSNDNSWTNHGTITALAGTVVLDGSYTLGTGTVLDTGGGTLVLGGSFQNAGSTLALPGNTILNADIFGGTVTTTGGGPLRVVGRAGFHDGVVLDCDLDVSGELDITGGLTFDGLITLGDIDTYDSGSLVFLGGDQALAGTGTILFTDPGGNQIAVRADPTVSLGASLTIGAGITVHGSRGSINPYHFALINNGTIDADVPEGSIQVSGGDPLFDGTLINNGTMKADGGSLSLAFSGTGAGNAGTLVATGGGTLVASGTWSNAGAMVAQSGGTLNLSGAWTDPGSITVDAGTVILGGEVELAATSTFDGDDGTLRLSGTIDGSANPLVIDGAGLVLELAGGTIRDAAVQLLDGAVMTGTRFGGTLDGVTLEGDLELTNVAGAGVTVVHGFVLDGEILLGNQAGTTYARLDFQGAQTLAGSGTITLGGSPKNALANASTGGGDSGALTVAPGVAIAGSAGSVGGGAAPLIVQGSVTAQGAGGVLNLRFGGTGSTNEGQLGAQDGGTLEITGSWADSGLISADGGGTVDLLGDEQLIPPGPSGGGGAWGGSGGTLTLSGTVDLADSTLSVTGSGLSLELAGGTITGGTLDLGTTTLRGTASGGTLDGVTLEGDLDLATAPYSSVTVTGGLVLDGNVTLGDSSGDNVGVLEFVGSQTLSGTGTVLLGASAANAVDNVASGDPGDDGTLTIAAGITVEGDSGVLGNSSTSLVNDGTIVADGSLGFVTVAGPLTNNGTLRATAGGTLAVEGGLTNVTAGILTGGNYQVDDDSSLELDGVDIATNAATILLDGPGARLVSDASDTSALAALAANATGGLLTIRNGGALGIAGAFSSAGLLVIGDASTFTTQGIYTQAAGGSTQLDGGTLASSAQVVIDGGSLVGVGTVIADVENDGEIDPGGVAAAGILAIQGDYTQSADGILNIDLGGTTPGTQYDRLAVSGTATLDGALNVTLIGSYVPEIDDSFVVLTFGSRASAFATMDGLDPGVGLELDPVYDAGNLTLTTAEAGEGLLANDPGTGDGGTSEEESTSDPGSGPSTIGPDGPDGMDLEASLTTFVVTTTADSGPGSLRQAILDSNSNTSGESAIIFEIGAAGVFTIALQSALPEITSPVTIDATPPEGFEGEVIVLDGQEAGSDVDGLDISAGETTVRGLVIDGFSGAGIRLTGAGHDVIVGNTIGLSADGTEAVGNGGSGIVIEDTDENEIGGTAEGDGNVIAGNAGDGLTILGTDARDNEVKGNFIGTNTEGDPGLGNGGNGITIEQGAAGNKVEDGNVIAANEGDGIAITGAGTSLNEVKGNLIGTDAGSDSGLGNQGYGVSITLGAHANTVEGGNVIAANGGGGVLITGIGTNGNEVSSNFIGTDALSTLGLGNFGNGVTISNGAYANTVEKGSAAGNVIAANAGAGVAISGAATIENEVKGNFIGTDAGSHSGLGNFGAGVLITQGAQSNKVEDGNVIVDNASGGVAISGKGTSKNEVAGNFIGTDSNSFLNLGNLGNGVSISLGASGNEVKSGNVIAGNAGDGIAIADRGTRDNEVTGNYIGTDKDGTAGPLVGGPGSPGLGNAGHGITISLGASGNKIEQGNVIASNGLGGIAVGDRNTTGNEIKGNYIGAFPSGGSGVISTGLGNGGDGIAILGGATNTKVEGGNVIAGNAGDGIRISGTGTARNSVEGNYIGTDALFQTGLGNTGNGVAITLGASGNKVEKTNYITSNHGDGVWISDPGTTGNEVSGNFIGTGPNCLVGLGNDGNGVSLRAGASDNKVEKNTIEGNGGDGVLITGAGTKDNTVEENDIGGDLDCTLGNAGDGVAIVDAHDNTVEKNTIVANGGAGVSISGPSATGNEIKENHIGTDADEAPGKGNAGQGVVIKDGASDNTVEDNTIDNNQLDGVLITGPGTSHNTVEKNAIKRNGGRGVAVEDGASDNEVEDNEVEDNAGDGVAIDGEETKENRFALNAIKRNGGNGVFITNFASKNTIDRNTIADNVETGVFVDSGVGNEILANSITGNGNQGIVLGETGNEQQWPPDLYYAENDGGVTTVKGSFRGEASTTYTLEFFENDEQDPSGYGQGKTLIGTITVTTDGDGQADIRFVTDAALGTFISATATDDEHNTSAFSYAVMVDAKIPDPLFDVYHYVGLIDDGHVDFFFLVGAGEEPEIAWRPELQSGTATLTQVLAGITYEEAEDLGIS